MIPEHTYKALRDEFAKFAMQAVLTSPHTIQQSGNKIQTESDVAATAYAIADAMLKERNK